MKTELLGMIPLLTSAKYINVAWHKNKVELEVS